MRIIINSLRTKKKLTTIKDTLKNRIYFDILAKIKTVSATPYAPKEIDSSVASFFETAWCSAFFVKRMRKASTKKPQLTKIQSGIKQSTKK